MPIGLIAVVLSVLSALRPYPGDLSGTGLKLLGVPLTDHNGVLGQVAP